MKLFPLIFLISLTACSSMQGGRSSKSAAVAMLSGEPCHGGMARQGYLVPSAYGDSSCPTGTQFCSAGKWDGPTLYDSCESHTKSCGASPHGSSVSGFLQPTSPKGTPCAPVTKTCFDGNWVGPEVFPTCSETP